MSHLPPRKNWQPRTHNNHGDDVRADILRSNRVGKTSQHNNSHNRRKQHNPLQHNPRVAYSIQTTQGPVFLVGAKVEVEIRGTSYAAEIHSYQPLTKSYRCCYERDGMTSWCCVAANLVHLSRSSPQECLSKPQNGDAVQFLWPADGDISEVWVNGTIVGSPRDTGHYCIEYVEGESLDYKKVAASDIRSVK